MERVLSSNPDITPEMREMVERLTTSVGRARWSASIVSIVVYSVFGLLGGLIGVAIFKRNLPPPPPPGTIDIPVHRRWSPATAAPADRGLAADGGPVSVQLDRGSPTGFRLPTRNFLQ